MRRFSVAATLMMTGLLPGCRCEKETPPAPPPPPSTSASATAPSEAPECEPAYVGVDGVGVFEICDGEIEKVLELEGAVKEIEVSPTGTVWVSAVGGIWRVDEEVTQVDKTQRDAIAVVSDKDVWATNFDGVAHYTGGSWALEDKSLLGENVTELRDVAADNKGNLWVLSSYGVHNRPAKGSWIQIDLSPLVPEQASFNRMALGSDNHLYVSWASGLLLQRTDGWRKVDVGSGTFTLDQIAVGPDKSVAALSPPATIYVVRPGQAPQKTEPGAESGLQATVVTALAVDNQARVWLATDYGLAIVKDGKLVRQWPPGTLSLLAGRISAVAVVGTGPGLPPVGVQAKGTVTGRLEKAGKPVAKATVALCPSPTLAKEEAPCEGAPVALSAETDAEGRFTLENVPVGALGMAIQRGKAWELAPDATCCQELKAGQSLDLGAVELPGAKKPAAKKPAAP